MKRTTSVRGERQDRAVGNKADCIAVACQLAKSWRTKMLLLIVAGASGCGSSGPFPTAEVRGTVSYNDKPLTGGTVVLHPTNGTPGPQGLGKIDEKGGFRVTTLGKFGAAVGDHRVTIDFRRTLTAEESRNLVIPELLIPAKYAAVDTTPLTATVEQGKENVLDLTLTD